MSTGPADFCGIPATKGRIAETGLPPISGLLRTVGDLTVHAAELLHKNPVAPRRAVKGRQTRAGGHPVIRLAGWRSAGYTGAVKPSHAGWLSLNIDHLFIALSRVWEDPEMAIILGDNFSTAKRESRRNRK
jgi:hypothetical protein